MDFLERAERYKNFLSARQAQSLKQLEGSLREEGEGEGEEEEEGGGEGAGGRESQPSC